ncbi:DUF2007 domain-containing protein [Luteimonas vadosa]|uniref:DUF2007 domain-containing protein n=1 Tax=Luteimonas vadosa TaxID=1165507 RepID=A0ABP9DS37_9GAMM
MVPVYDAAHATDAHLIKHLLEDAGIPSYIRGEHLQGGLGELPVHGLVSVCVPESEALRARAIVVEWQEGVPGGDDLDE